MLPEEKGLIGLEKNLFKYEGLDFDLNQLGMF